MGKILIPQKIAQEGIDCLILAGHQIKMETELTEEALIQEVKDCDAILLRTAKISRKVLEAGKRLKIVARHGAGYNNVDIQAAQELGIWVTNTPDATTNTVAEFTIAALLASSKRILEMNQAVKSGDFFYKNEHTSIDLAGKTLGIIGLGRIGSAVAKKAYFGLEMKIAAYAHHKNRKNVPDYVCLTDWETLFKQADFITLHLPLREETRGIIGKTEFGLMKNSAYLINCSRGELVNEGELIDSLRQGEIAGAFCDVLEQEPPSPDNPLLSMKQVIVTPHMASNTRECMVEMACGAASQINLVLAGKEPEWALNHPCTADKH